MPVARGPQINTRSAILIGLSGVVIAAVLFAGVLFLASSGGTTEIRLGDKDFAVGGAERISAEIKDRGPAIFSDVASGRRDIIVQHLGDDPETGWLAFDVRPQGSSGSCFFEWKPESRMFELKSGDDGVECPEVSVDESGTGLVQYPVIVEDGTVRVDIVNPVKP